MLIFPVKVGERDARASTRLFQNVIRLVSLSDVSPVCFVDARSLQLRVLSMSEMRARENEM